MFQKWSTNLTAGLFSVVSSLNEYICFIIVTHWLGKGGIIGLYANRYILRKKFIIDHSGEFIILY